MVDGREGTDRVCPGPRELSLSSGQAGQSAWTCGDLTKNKTKQTEINKQNQPSWGKRWTLLAMGTNQNHGTPANLRGKRVSITCHDFPAKRSPTVPSQGSVRQSPIEGLVQNKQPVILKTVTVTKIKERRMKCFRLKETKETPTGSAV